MTDIGAAEVTDPVEAATTTALTMAPIGLHELFDDFSIVTDNVDDCHYPRVPEVGLDVGRS